MCLPSWPTAASTRRLSCVWPPIIEGRQAAVAPHSSLQVSRERVRGRFYSLTLIPTLFSLQASPSPPTVTTDPGVRGVFVEWQSFSHLPILRYLVEITLEEDNIIISQLIPGPIPHTSESVNPLRPFTEYTVTVTAVNRAGNNSASVNFITLQAG